MNKLFYLLSAACFVLSSCESTPGPNVSVKGKPPVSSLVKLGDNLDQAISILRRNGHKVSDKYFASVNKDYWFATVFLGRPIPLRATIYETFGTSPFLGSGPAIYVILEAGLDGRIRKLH